MALLKFKRSAVPSKAPALGDLELGELAINTYDGKVYMKKDNGTASIVEVGGAGGGGTVTSVAGTGTVNGITLTGTVTSSGSLTLGGTLSGVSLTSQVSGTLPVANGGTGATSLTSGYLIKGNGTSAASASVVYDNGTNVGFGTSSPAYRVDIASADTTAGLGYAVRIRANATAAGGTIQFTDSAVTAQWGFIASTSNALTLDCSGSGSVIFRTNGSERARIDSSGNFGIGTSSPGSYRLNVQGNVFGTTYSFGANEHLFYQVDASTIGIRIGTSGPYFGIGTTGSDNLRINNASGGDMLFAIAGTERARINNSGNFGIGTNSPSSLLDVNGNAEVAGTLFLGASNHGNIASDSNTLYLRGTNIAFQNAAGSGTYAYINSSGVLSVGGSNVAIGLQSTGQQVIASSTALTSSGNAGSNILVVTAGITVTLPTSAISGKAITISNISSGSITLSYAGSNGTDGPTTMAAGTSLMLISDGGSPPFWRLTLPFGAFDGSTLFEAGYKILPQNQRTGAYTLALSDAGKHLYVTAGAFATTIPADATLNFPVGTAITFVCEDAGKTIVPASGVTLVLAGTGAATTGTRTLAIGAVATLIKVQANRWYISGSGVT